MSSESDASDDHYRPRFGANDRLATARAVVESQDALQALRGRHERVARECEALRRREKELSYAARKLESELDDARAQLAEQRTVRPGVRSSRASPLTDSITVPERRSAHAIRRTRAASAGRISMQAHGTPLSAARTPRARLSAHGAKAAVRGTRMPSPCLTRTTSEAPGHEMGAFEQLREQLSRSERRCQQLAAESAARDAEQHTRIASLERLCARLTREEEERWATHSHSARALDKLSAQLAATEQRHAQLEVDLAQRNGQLERLRREHAAQHGELRQALRALALGSSSIAPRVAAWPTPRAEQQHVPGGRSQGLRVEAGVGLSTHASRRPQSSPGAAPLPSGRAHPRSTLSAGAAHSHGSATRQGNGEERYASRHAAVEAPVDLSPKPSPSRRYDEEGMRYAARRTARPASVASSASSEPHAAQLARLEEMKAIDQEVDDLHKALELTTRRLVGLPSS
jgi:predicted  nucleic acid-binding Zn-ribbon protein